MPKFGQARVPTPEEQEHLFKVIKEHRHPEKNTAIMQISFKLGLRAQEIALLKIKDVTLPKSGPSYLAPDILEVMTLPAAYTKGANALQRSKSKYERKTISFGREAFEQVLRQVEALAKSGGTINAENFYPPEKKHRGKSRDLPIVDNELRDSLKRYIEYRYFKEKRVLKPNSPLFITQKGGPYSPNTLQEHMSLMLRSWAGIEKASSHSGRRSLITNVIHKQKKSVKVAQKIAGHVSPATTIIYEEPPEEEISEALKNTTT